MIIPSVVSVKKKQQQFDEFHHFLRTHTHTIIGEEKREAFERSVGLSLIKFVQRLGGIFIP